MKKNISSLVFILALLVPGVGMTAGAEQSKKASVTVVFDRPDQFTDIKDAFMPTEKGQEAIMAEIRRFVESRAKSCLQSGQKLEVKFTDINLAGEFEPQRGPGFQDVRIFKAIYSPRLKLEFKLVDADGKLVSEGKRELKDVAYQSRMAFPLDDGLRYEKDMLRDWINDEFQSAKVAGH